MSENNSIVNFGNLAKPAIILIEKISDAVGGIFKPLQIKRIAKAEAVAEKIKALTKIEISDLEQRGLQRFAHEEGKKQANMESIVCQALPLLKGDAKPDKIEEDWILHFFDKCRLISSEEMQILWANVLAGEANSPGKFSKRAINLLATLDKNDALQFTKLCGFNWVIKNESIPLIFDHNSKIYKDNGINFALLNNLNTIGLITFESLSGYIFQKFVKQTVVFYNKIPVSIQFPKETNNDLQVGHVLLTNAGAELASICTPEPIDGFVEYVKGEWTKSGLQISSPIVSESSVFIPPQAM